MVFKVVLISVFLTLCCLKNYHLFGWSSLVSAGIWYTQFTMCSVWFARHSWSVQIAMCHTSIFKLTCALSATHAAIPKGNDFPKPTTCTSDLTCKTCTTTHTFPSPDASSAEVLPEDFFTGMFKDLNLLLAAHNSTQLKPSGYSRSTSYSLNQALIEDAMDCLLPSLWIRTLM